MNGTERKALRQDLKVLAAKLVSPTAARLLGQLSPEERGRVIKVSAKMLAVILRTRVSGQSQEIAKGKP